MRQTIQPLAQAGGFPLEGADMGQILIALYIALSEAAGGAAARAVANRVLLDAIKNHSIDDEQLQSTTQS
jgi:hypothetical protein